MDRDTTKTAVITALLVAGAMLLGSMAFPRVEVREAPRDDYVPEEALRVEAAPDPAPALAPMRVAEESELSELRARVVALEALIASLREQQAQALQRLEPIFDAIEEHERQRLGGGNAVSAQETAAIATLRNATSAQAQTQATGRIDTDQDGTGEYGGFLEMSGELEGRMNRVLVPPVLSGAFRKMQDGVVVRNGYCYRIFLPDSRGAGVAEPVTGFANDGSISADLSETTWCCYAWPLEYGVTGTRTFFGNQAGDVLSTEDARYSGTTGGPRAEAAFHPKTGGAITGLTAVGTKGNDGNLWKQSG